MGCALCAFGTRGVGSDRGEAQVKSVNESPDPRRSLSWRRDRNARRSIELRRSIWPRRSTSTATVRVRRSGAAIETGPSLVARAAPADGEPRNTRVPCPPNLLSGSRSCQQSGAQSLHFPLVHTPDHGLDAGRYGDAHHNDGRPGPAPVC
jgi:hypothetical protein